MTDETIAVSTSFPVHHATGVPDEPPTPREPPPPPVRRRRHEDDDNDVPPTPPTEPDPVPIQEPPVEPGADRPHIV